MKFPLAHLAGFPHFHPHGHLPLLGDLLPALLLGLILACLGYGTWRWFRKK